MADAAPGLVRASVLTAEHGLHDMSPPGREPIVIACAADDRYVQPLAVMLQSVLANLSDRRMAIYIVDGGIEPRHKQDLARSWDPSRCSVHWVSAQPSSFSGLPLWGRMRVATYYKLLIAEFLPSSACKAIWLDCDLVVATDLARLWDTDLEGRHALAVQDQAVPFVSSSNGVACHGQLGIASDAPYFNAGVMVVDLDLWRRDEIPRRVVEYLRQHRDTVVFWDQEGLNAILASRWGMLDPRWNYNPYARDSRLPAGNRAVEVSASLINPWIIHFTGNLKPWTYPRRDFAHGLYFHHLDRTAWAGWRPKRSLKGMMVEMYEGSGLRNALYPGEEWFLWLLRTITRTYASEATR